MKKSDFQPLPEYFDRYINLVDDVSLDEAFRISIDEISAFDWERCQQLGDRVYAPGKWRIADIMQHLLDWERIFTYRALIFLRETGMKAESMDEDQLAASAAGNPSSLEELKAEMIALRQSTRLFFRSMNDADLRKTGTSWRSQMSVLHIGFTMLGHQRHHFNVIRERYFTMP
jgi:hypothetical protein